MTKNRNILFSVAAAVSAGLLLTVTPAFAAETTFDLGPFQPAFVQIRPYVMVGFLALGVYALIHNLGRSLTGTLKPRADGTAAHGASLSKLLELVVFIVALEVLVYLILWYGLDLFSATINLFTSATA